MGNIGDKYVYLGQFVKVLELNCDEALIETRFWERATVDVEELSLKIRSKK